MKEYIKPEIEVVNFTTEVITGKLEGEGTSDPSIWD